MGLRETQKEMRRRAILAAATRLFVKRGYDHAKTEEIAEIAGVSIGTLYNYFQTKGELLLTLATEESERILAGNEEFARDPKGTPSQALSHLLSDYFAPQNVCLNRELWRLGIALSFSDPDSPAAITFRQADQRLCDQVIELATTLRDRGALPADLDTQILGSMLFNSANMLFFDFNRTPQMTLSHLQNDVGAMTANIVDMITSANLTGDKNDDTSH